MAKARTFWMTATLALLRLWPLGYVR